MVDPVTAYLAIALMTIVTLGTRLGGAYVMRFVRVSPRITGFLEAMSASVLAAVVVTFLVRHGAREVGSVGVAMLLMFLTRSAVWAMMGAIAFAAAWHAMIG